jgi:hypothetical protein
MCGAIRGAELSTGTTLLLSLTLFMELNELKV